MEPPDSHDLHGDIPAPAEITPLLGHALPDENAAIVGPLRSPATPLLAAEASTGFFGGFWIASVDILCKWWHWFWGSFLRGIDFLLEPVKPWRDWNQNSTIFTFYGGTIWWFISVPFFVAVLITIRALSVVVSCCTRFAIPGAHWEEVESIFRAVIVGDRFIIFRRGYPPPHPVIVASLHVHEECYTMLWNTLFLLSVLTSRNALLLAVTESKPLPLLADFFIRVMTFSAWLNYLGACQQTLKYITAYATRPPDGSMKDLRFALSGIIFGTTIVSFGWCLGRDIGRNLVDLALVLTNRGKIQDLPEVQVALLGSSQSLHRWGLLLILPFAVCGWLLLLTSLVHAIICVAPCLQRYHSIPPSSFRRCIRCYKERESIEAFNCPFDLGTCNECVQEGAHVRADEFIVSDHELNPTPFTKLDQVLWGAVLPLAPVLRVPLHMFGWICMALVRGVTFLRIPDTLAFVLWLPVETFYGTDQFSGPRRHFSRALTSATVDVIIAAILLIKLPSAFIISVPLKIVCCWWKPMATNALVLKDIATFTGRPPTQPRNPHAYFLSQIDTLCFALLIILMLDNTIFKSLSVFYPPEWQVWALIVALPAALCTTTLVFPLLVVNLLLILPTTTAVQQIVSLYNWLDNTQ